MFGPISAAYTILSFHHAHALVQGPRGTHTEPRDAHPLEDAARQDASHASSGMERAHTEREREQT
jgi:hypothetical protein